MVKKKSALYTGKILWLEGRWVNHPDFLSVLKNKGLEIDTVYTGKKALFKIDEQTYDLIVIDADSMRTSGVRICSSIKEKSKDLPILFIASSEHYSPVEDQVNIFLQLPFTARKLINRVIPFLPNDGNKVLESGPIKLDLERNQVDVNGKMTLLTPRLSHLLQRLIENNGEIVKREELFKEVWRTDYTGDTRTLDVHISWLRQAIEEDPRKPKMLKTIRGKGYRLTV
ncbi:MAG: response regulator transcription factor [Anaerolineales bacterium]|nr:response regulator transcription factor [Anaerolineales bacterium]